MFRAPFRRPAEACPSAAAGTPASEMTELLRAGKDADYPALPVKHAFDRGCDLLAVIERHTALAELYAIP